MERISSRISLLAMAIASAGMLGACGGGGGGDNVRPDPPPQGPPPYAPPPPADPVVGTPNPDYSRHLTWTGAGEAHAAGLTGAGVRIGIVDSGVNRDHPAMRDSRVVANISFIDPASNNLSVGDVLGHGTAVAQVAAGKPFGAWPGGIAPGAQIVSARILSDKPPEDDGSGRGNPVEGALGLAPVHRALMDFGARIMNNSWGGLYWTNPAATAQIAAEYRPFIAQHGGLVVFSNGNAGFADPSDMAALPSQAGSNGTLPAADLERGWLTVGALDGSDPTRLAEYSNACGVAMRYCLVAPGTVAVTGTNDAPDAPVYWRWNGTSFAAPIVSGAAALVWEAFPYFDNDLVRQTLLGTARDLGAPGVDAVFGNGALDIAAAVRGPARLDWGDVTADFDGITSTWSNDLSGAGALVKRGSGTLVLAGEAANSGGVRVEAGTLQARWLGSDVAVWRGGVLAMGGGVAGDLDNAGRLEVHGGAQATTGIGGDYRHRDGATLAVDLGQRLLVGGQATLEGGTLHLMGVKRGYTTSAREGVLEAGGGLSGRFGGLTWADSLFLQGSLDYTANAVWLDIARLDVAAAARAMAGARASTLSSAARMEAAFRQLDRAGAMADAAPALVQAAADFQALGDEAAAVSALDSLSGDAHARATTLAFDTLDMGRRALSLRMGVDRNPAGVQVWRQSLGRGGGTGMAGDALSFDAWLQGREHAFGNTVAGFAFGEARSEDRFGGRDERSHDRQTMAQAYLGRRFGDSYAMAQLGSGRFDRRLERRLYAGEGARDGIFSQYAGGYTTLGVEAGHRLALAGAALTAYLGAERSTLRSDGFEEVGATGFALRGQAGKLERSQAIAGLRSAFDWHGIGLRAHAEWQQTLSARGFDLQASYVGIDSWAPLPMAEAAQSGGLFGLGLDAPLGRGAALSLGIDRRFGPRGDERMASMRYVFAF
jgi:autotransporter-associated beta strand protein